MTTTHIPMIRVIDAIAFAAHAHRLQRRKDADATPFCRQFDLSIAAKQTRS